MQIFFQVKQQIYISILMQAVMNILSSKTADQYFNSDASSNEYSFK